MLGNRTDVERPQLTGGLLDSIARFVGATPDATRRVLDAALPTVMYEIADRGSTEMGARWLLDGWRTGHVPEVELRDLGRVLEDPQARDHLISGGSGLTQQLFGARLGPVLDRLGRQGAIGPSGMSKLMALASPLAMGIIGRRARADELDAEGVAQFLTDQKPKVARLVPASVQAALEIPMPMMRPRLREVNGLQRPRSDEPPVPKEAMPEGRPAWVWVLVVLLAVAAATVLPRILRHRHEQPASPTRPVSSRALETFTPEAVVPAPIPVTPAPPPTETPPPAAAVPSPAAPAPPPAAAPAPAVALRSDSQAVRAMRAALDDNNAPLPRGWPLDGVEFDPDQTSVPDTAGPVEDDLAALLGAHPDARIRLIGNSDTGFGSAANDQLAGSRAQGLKDAIVEKGIASDRIEATFNTATGPRPLTEPTATSPAQRRIDLILLSR